MSDALTEALIENPVGAFIEVIRCGALTTIQDAGRHGFRHLGVSQTGALDPIAMQQANLLLGNAPDAAVLEISVGPLVLHFPQDCAIAMSGSGFAAARNAPDATALLPGHVSIIHSGETLTLNKPLIPGARCYLAFSGGIDVPTVLGSRSTDMQAGFGGLEGRALQAGDKLPIGAATQPLVKAGRGIRPLSPSHILRALPGPDYESFTTDSQVLLWSQPWRISHQSNRMGLRLKGTALQLEQTLDQPSAGVLPGDVQVPPDGLPIVLANDAQTIGGYPRIASVIRADLWQLAHFPPGTSVYFVLVSLQEAIAASARQAHYLKRLQELVATEQVFSASGSCK
ncbi:MAG: biotin-dependent carboxyltransferase family protein [Pseudomonadota bacterium]